MLQSVEQRLVVDLVSEDDQAEFARDLYKLLEVAFRIERSGRVVRIDDDDAARARGNFRTNVFEIGQPAGAFIGCLHGTALPGCMVELVGLLAG